MPETHNKLHDILLETIDANGFIALGEYISCALGHPEYGYYTARDPLGAQGDFTTAPEISQMFGEIIGAWVIDVWTQMGAPSVFNLIEIGPGRGTLMADILRVCSKAQGFTEASRAHCVETSPVLRQKQKEALSALPVCWHDTIGDIPTDHPAIMIGNEFLDALPIEQLKRTKNGWQQKIVVRSGKKNELAFDWREAEDDLRALLPKKTVSNEIYEISPARLDYSAACLELLKKVSGVALFIDYGYRARHYGDTLQAVQSHKFVNVLESVGQCDLTSHIDFESLQDHLSVRGANILPCVTQGAFLQSLGIEFRAEYLKKSANQTQKQDITLALDRLITPQQMGDVFKVLCFYAGVDIKPSGFS